MSTKELVRALIEQNPHPKETDAHYAWVAEGIGICDRIAKETNANKSAKRKITEDYKKSIELIDLREKEIQKSCKHWTRTYYPDPSGNSDSFYECDVCGATL